MGSCEFVFSYLEQLRVLLKNKVHFGQEIVKQLLSCAVTACGRCSMIDRASSKTVQCSFLQQGVVLSLLRQR